MKSNSGAEIQYTLWALQSYSSALEEINSQTRIVYLLAQTFFAMSTTRETPDCA